MGLSFETFPMKNRGPCANEIHTPYADEPSSYCINTTAMTTWTRLFTSSRRVWVFEANQKGLCVDLGYLFQLCNCLSTGTVFAHERIILSALVSHTYRQRRSLRHSSL